MSPQDGAGLQDVSQRWGRTARCLSKMGQDCRMSLQDGAGLQDVVGV